MKIHMRISRDYMITCYDFGKTKFSFHEETRHKFQFGYLTTRFQKIYKEELKDNVYYKLRYGHD